MSHKNKNILPKKSSPLMTAAKLSALVSSLVFCGMTALSGAGLIYNRQSYGSELAAAGLLFIISAAMMTSGAVLCLFRKNIPNTAAIVLSAAGLVICLIILKKLTDRADAGGWTDKYTLEPISGMYNRRILPCIIPAAVTAAISAVQLCSYELKEQRRARKAAKLAKKNSPAPSILDGE